MCIGSVVVVGKTGGHDKVMNGLCATLKKKLYFILEMLESVKQTCKIRFAI